MAIELGTQLVVSVVTAAGTQNEHRYDVPSDSEELSALFDEIMKTKNNLLDNILPWDSFSNPWVSYSSAHVVSIGISVIQVSPGDDIGKFKELESRALGFRSNSETPSNRQNAGDGTG